jgi:hypothetical protein
MANSEFECPVCSAKLNTRGEPFVSVRAVALHIAGKIKGNCTDHKIWAYENRSKEEIDEAIAEAKATEGINILADLLLLPVKHWHDDKGKPNIGFKKQ